MDYPIFKVCVRCFTFNQSKYITDAMNSFCMQQTNFPYVCCIVDDASTDGEQNVINHYLEVYFNLTDSNVSFKKETDYAHIIYAQHKENKNCYFSVLLLKENHYSKKPKKSKIPYIYEWRSICEYEAMCEGDDYWIDVCKLQKQVDVLDTHPNMYLCGTNGIVYYEGLFKNPKYFNQIIESREISPSDIIGKWLFPSASIMYKTSMDKDYPEWTKKVYSGDQTRILLALYFGGVFALNDITCIYRKTRSELSASNSARKRSRNFVTDQHIILYSEFDKFTKGKYNNIISPLLKCLSRKSRVYKSLNKSLLLGFLIDPLMFIKIAMKSKSNL